MTIHEMNRRYPITLLLALTLVGCFPQPRSSIETPSTTSTTKPTQTETSVQPLTEEQAKKLFFNSSLDCVTEATTGDPRSKNYPWDQAVKVAVIEAYRNKGQPIINGSESNLYELARVAIVKSAEGLSKEEVASYLTQQYVPNYQKSEIDSKTAEIAVEVGSEVYLPKVVERVRFECASFKSEADAIISKEESKPTAANEQVNDNARLKANEQTSPSASPIPAPKSTTSTRTAVLIASDSNSRINLRATPSTSGNLLGYGLVGDQVQVINQTTGDERKTWYLVKFPRSGAQGWIREDFVSVK
jgi:hypothetical protein